MGKNNIFLFVVGILLAALFQLIPVMLTKKLVIATILSTIPIYIIARKSVGYGILGYVLTIILVSLVSPHEGLFFALTNGLVGALLGIITCYTEGRGIADIVTTLALAVALIFINYVKSIPVFGTELPWNLLLQVIFIVVFSLVYVMICNRVLNYIYLKFANK